MCCLYVVRSYSICMCIYITYMQLSARSSTYLLPSPSRNHENISIKVEIQEKLKIVSKVIDDYASNDNCEPRPFIIIARIQVSNDTGVHLLSN